MTGLFEVLKEYIKKDIDDAIKYANLKKLDQEEKDRINMAGYNSKIINLENINDLLIDYSDRELNDEDLLDMLDKSDFIFSLEYNDELYLLYPVFKYLIGSSNEDISRKAVYLFLDKYKKYFADSNFETSNDRSIKASEFFEIVDLLYKPNTKSELESFDIKNDIVGISRFNWMLRKKLSNRIDYTELSKSHVNIDDLKSIINLYIEDDFTNCSDTYMYNKLLDKLNSSNDNNEKEEITFLINTINCSYLIPFKEFSFDAFDRILDKCDQNNISLSVSSINKITKFYKEKCLDYKEINIIKKEFRLFSQKYYDFNINRFHEYLNKKYEFDNIFGSNKVSSEMLLDVLGYDYNYFVNMFGNHKSLDEYKKNNEETKNKELKQLDDFYNNNHNFLNKYSKQVNELKNMGDNLISIELYAYKNIPEEDRKKFIDLVKFYGNNGEIETFKFSRDTTKENTFAEVLNIALKELSNSDFNDFDKIVVKYMDMLTRFNTYCSSHYKKLFRDKCNQNKGLIANNYIKNNIDVINNIKNSNLFVELYYNNYSFINAIFHMNTENNPELKDIYDRVIRDKKIFYDDLYNAGIAQFDIDEKIELLPLYLNNKDEFFNAISYIHKDNTTICNNHYLIILNFINCKYLSRDEYLRKENISLPMFNKALEFCRENNPDLVKEYNEKLYKLSQERFYPVVNNAKDIINYILNGYDDPDGSHRDFEYLDYKLLTKMTIDEFIKFIKEKHLINNPDESRIVLRWLNAKKNIVPLYYKDIKNMTYIIGGVQVSDEVKDSIVNYLKANGINNDARAFNQALTRYMNGKLTIDGKNINDNVAKKH